MSVYDVGIYHVAEAAREMRFDHARGTDVVTLYIKSGSSLRDHRREGAWLPPRVGLLRAGREALTARRRVGKRPTVPVRPDGWPD